MRVDYRLAYDFPPGEAAREGGGVLGLNWGETSAVLLAAGSRGQKSSRKAEEEEERGGGGGAGWLRKEAEAAPASRQERH